MNNPTAGKPPAERRAMAAGAAREYMRLSGEALAMNSDRRAVAFALQGLLRLQIEATEAKADPPETGISWGPVPVPEADGGRWHTRP